MNLNIIKNFTIDDIKSIDNVCAADLFEILPSLLKRLDELYDNEYLLNIESALNSIMMDAIRFRDKYFKEDIFDCIVDNNYKYKSIFYFKILCSITNGYGKIQPKYLNLFNRYKEDILKNKYEVVSITFILRTLFDNLFYAANLKVNSSIVVSSIELFPNIVMYYILGFKDNNIINGVIDCFRNLKNGNGGNYTVLSSFINFSFLMEDLGLSDQLSKDMLTHSIEYMKNYGRKFSYAIKDMERSISNEYYYRLIDYIENNYSSLKKDKYVGVKEKLISYKLNSLV